MNIIYTTSFWYGVGHHASFSGYHQLVKHVKAANVVICPQQTIRSNPIVDTLFYTGRSLKIEFTALASNGELIHHLYGEDICLISPFLKKAFGKKILATLHQPPAFFEDRAPFWWKRMLEKIDHIIVLSTAQQAFLSKILGNNQSVSYVPHGVEFDRFRPSSYERKNCLIVGRWLRDFDTARKVIRETERRRIKIKFDIVLPKTTTKNAAKIKDASLFNTCIHYNIDEETLLELYSRSRMFLLPLLDFTASNSLLEAMASRLPIIITDVGGARDYVDEKNGIFARKSDSDAMVEALTYLLEDEGACKTMGRESRAKAYSFSWDKVSQQYVEIYSRWGL